MDVKQNLDPSSLELQIQKELAYRKKVPCSRNEVENPSRSPSFREWTQTASRFHNSSPMPNNQMGQSSIKMESIASEPSGPKFPTSGSKDWIGPSNLPNTKSQARYTSHEAPPMVPFPSDKPINKPDSTPRTNTSKYSNQVQKPTFSPRPSIPPVCLEKFLVSSEQNQTPKKPCLGLKRKATESPSQSPTTSEMTIKSSDDLLCELCQQHLNGRRHKAKMEWRRIEGKPSCDVCQIWCTDYKSMEMHLKGQKHKEKVQELELCKKNGGDNVVKKKPILCELCLVHCMNEELFEMHIKGRSHGVKEELQRRGMI
ncbi:hypothetical protein CDL12_03444 [Handroanthus impetiginosus]|uniref:C2H2-type domain-containing protein n=1 Tax=Handroanthus impetiginosus TaxID=429701 RepID=A0A2G9I250_9LAMI|nr:hypothetical protein CDL12_03444 [Handroanthus impetiginosus]